MASAAIFWGACRYSIPVIGFIRTEPVSIPINDPQLGSLLLDVSSVMDTIKISAPGQATYEMCDIRHTAGYSLSQAFASTFPTVTMSLDDTIRYELRLLLLSVNYRPLGYYSHTENRQSPFSFGPQTNSGSTTKIHPYSLETEYKAVLYESSTLVATFGRVVDSPGVWDMQMNLKKAIERMAEHLNTDVVEFLLKREQE